MNRYDYYTCCGSFDEQEWLTEELYYPEPEDCDSYEDYDKYAEYEGEEVDEKPR